MAIAGKVAPTFKGDYDATVTYQFYDVVRHNNSLWMSKKSNTLGIEPTTENAEYWFLAIDGSFTDASTLDGHDSDYFATAQSVTDITDGTTQVGDSAKLGGVDASEWQSEIRALGHKFAFSDNIQDMNAIGAFTAGIAYKSANNNTPSDMTSYGIVYTIGFNNNYQIQRLVDDSGTIFERGNYNGSFEAWKELATTADLANYFKNTGGTINGSIRQTVSGMATLHRFTTDNRDIEIFVSQDGFFQFYDYTNAKNIIYSTADGTSAFNGTASGNLPLGGGTIKADNPSIGFASDASPNTYGKVQKYGDGMRVGLYGSDGSFSNELVLGANVQDEHTLLRLLLNNSTFREVFHTGNTARVSIQETAPTDTTALWVDTANNTTKAYIDGAWTTV